MRKVELENLLTSCLHLKSPRFKLEKSGAKFFGSVISDTFKGKDDHLRQKMIWDALSAEFGDGAVRKVSTLLAYTNDEWDVDFEPRISRPRIKLSPKKKAAYESTTFTMIAVPVELVSKVQKLIAKRAS